MKSYVVSKDCKDYPNIVRSTYEILNRKFRTTARVSDIFELWRLSFGLDELELLDSRLIQNGEFQSYLMDRLIEWNSGKPVDLSEIYEAILQVGEFSSSEMRIIEAGEPEYRVWAIILAITDSGNQNKIY